MNRQDPSQPTRPPLVRTSPQHRPAARRSRLAWGAAALVAVAAFLALARAGGPARAQDAPALTATVTLGNPAITGRAPGGAELTAELFAAGGVLKGGATGNAIPFVGWFNLGLEDAEGQAVPVLAGDRLKLATAAGASIEGVAPALTIAGDADSDRVTGTAPPNAALTVTVSSGLGGDRAELGVVTDPSGSFAADFAGQFDLEAGTSLRAEHRVGSFRWRVERPLTAELNLRLYDASVGGLGPVGGLVRAELRDGVGGQPKAAGQTSTGFLGLFDLDLLDPAGAAVPLRPGDRLRLDFVGTASLDYRVPELDATADVAADTLSGTAPAGLEVAVSVGGGGNPPSRVATAGADGRFTVSFAGEVDLVPGSSGQLRIVERRAGLDVSVARAWGITRLTVRLGEARVEGVASAGEPVQLTLRDGLGLAKARATAQVAPGGSFGGGGSFAATLEDAEGDPVAALPTMRLEYRRPGESIDLAIPTITAEVDPGADRVTGEAPAGAALAITAGPFFNRETLDLVADAAGRYSADFAGMADITPGSTVEVRHVTAAGHRVILETAAAAMRVWPEAGRVDGTVSGNTAVKVAVLDGRGNTRAEASGSSNFAGQFNLAFADAQGRPYYPATRNRLRLTFDQVTHEMIVPAMSIEWDTAGDTVSGEATPGGRVTVRAQPPAGQGNAAATRPITVPVTGFYLADFASEMDLRAGSRLQLTYTLPNGDRSRVDRVLPLLNVQVGGNALSGFALPRVDVAAALKDGARTAGSGAARAGDDQSFALRLLEAGGAAAAIRAGQTVEAVFDVRRLAATVGPLSASLVRGAEELVVAGEGPISRTLAARYQGGNGFARNGVLRTDQAGRYRAELPGGIDGLAGTRVEVSHLDAEGHRFYAIAVAPRLVAYLGMPRARLEAPPLAELRLRLAATPGGAALAQAQARADTEGMAEAELAGTRPTIAVSQTLSAEITTAEGPVNVAMTVADLALSLDTPANLVRGRAPVGQGFFGRFASLRAYLRGTPEPRTITVRTDAQGNFSLDTENAPGGGFPLASAEAIELVHTDAAGHQTVAVAVPRIAVFLPRLSNRQ